MRGTPVDTPHTENTRVMKVKTLNVLGDILRRALRAALAAPRACGRHFKKMAHQPGPRRFHGAEQPRNGVE